MMTNSSSDNIPRTLGQLALELHRTRSEKLSIDISTQEVDIFAGVAASQGFTVKEQELSFDSLHERNKCVAREVYQRGEVGDASSLFVAADNLFKYDVLQTEHAGTYLLLLASESRDVLLEAADALAASSQKPYGIANLVGEAIRSIKPIRFASLLTFCCALQSANNGSMVASPFFVSLVDLLRDDEGLRSEVVSTFEAVPSEASTDLYRAALLAFGIVDFDAALRHAGAGVKLGVPLVRDVSLWVLARCCAKRQLPDYNVELVEDVLKPHLQNQGSEAHRKACDVVAACLPFHELCADEWTRLLQEEDEAAMLALAAELPAIYRARPNSEAIPALLGACLGFDSKFVSEIGHIDHVLSLMLGTEQRDAATDWLTNWVRRHGSGEFNTSEVANLFDQSLYWLLKNTAVLEVTITSWLLEEGRKLPASAGGLLSHASLHDVGPLEFDIQQIDRLDADGLIFLCRRVLGFVLNEKQSISLMLSFLKTHDAPSRVHHLVREVLSEEIGYDYPTVTAQQLQLARAKSSDAAEQALLDDIVVRVGQWTSAIDELPFANELRPPAQIVRSFSRARQKDMSLKMKEAREKSILGRLATPVPVKGGTGFFRYVDAEFSKVTEMVPIHSSATLPRRDIFDPVGQANRRLHLQRLQRGDK
ncbi:hypothetical protein [Paraburkholderia sp. C35]|uniref:hypothetical protein n=1 Tax=Paraburkholderia sp. C35 TaxID=2126993 RepID=UPI0013A53ADE|nr:hypothetical protein [Paraburkholderia sp. C35]